MLGLDELQAGIKTARRNINNLRYADYTILMAKIKEELNNLLMKVKEECKSWLKTQHLKKEDHSIWSITSWQIDGGKSDLGSKITVDSETKRHLLLGKNL